MIQSFRIVTGGKQPERRDQAVQTELSYGQEKLHGLMKDFPNLQLGEGLLPDPKDCRARGENLEPIEWTVVVYPRNQRGGKEGDLSHSLFTPSIVQGVLGKAPMLWDSLCREEHPTEANDGSRAVWSGPSIRSELRTPDVKVRSYRILPRVRQRGP